MFGQNTPESSGSQEVPTKQSNGCPGPAFGTLGRSTQPALFMRRNGCCNCSSERNPPGKLQTPRPRAFGCLQGGDGAEAGRVDLHVGRLVVAVVEEVCGFQAELEFALLCDGKVFHQRERVVLRAGANHAAHRRVAEAADAVAGCGLQVEIGEGVGVEPLRRCALRRVDRDVAQLVGPRLADGGEDVGVGRIDALLVGREKRAALKDRHAAQLPVAGDAVERAPGVEPALAFAEGQIVEPGHQEAMPAVVDDVAVVEAGMEAVGEKTAAGHAEGVGRGAAGVGEIAREGVAGVEGERLAAVARDLDCAARIIALRQVANALDHAPAGIGAVVVDEGSAVGDTGGCGCGTGLSVEVAPGVGRNLVEIDHRLQILPVAGGVREARADGVAEVLLQGQIPLLHVGVVIVDGESIVESGGSSRASGAGAVDGGGEGEQRRSSVGGLVVGGHVAGVNGPAGDQRKSQRRFDETSPAAAQHCLAAAVRLPRKAQPRPPIGVVGGSQPFRNAGLCGGKDGCWRNGGQQRGRRLRLRLGVGDDDGAGSG